MDRRKLKSFVFTFSGKAGSGKDTFVKSFIEYIRKYACIYAPNYLESVLRYQVESGIDTTVFSFGLADYFKSVFSRNFGYTEDNKTEFRSQLQFFGTEIGRAYNEDFWVLTVKDMIKCLDYQTPCRLYIITDARFENELKMFEWSNEVVSVNINVIGNEDRNILTKDQQGHASEALSNDKSIVFDLTVKNTGTLDQLYQQAKEAAIDVLTVIEEGYGKE